MSHWNYIFRTCPGIDSLLLTILRTVFFPSLTGQEATNDELRDLFGLPCRLGGLGIPNPSHLSSEQYTNSLSVTMPLINLLLDQHDSISLDILHLQSKAKQTIHNTKAQAMRDHSLLVRNNLSPQLQRLFDIANEKGSSTWLSVVPIKSHGYHLHKGAFRDSLCLRYGWDPPSLPDSCVCGTSFSIDHALNCPFWAHFVNSRNL